MLGLELGADDYITKPFSLREFRCRVKAALRRAGMARARPGRRRRAARGPRAAHRPGQARASTCAASRSQTTFVEFEILTALARSPGRVFTRDMLLTRIWGDSRLPRPAHDRRPHPPPAREARARRQGARVPLHRARRRLPLPRHGAREPRASRCAVAHQPPGAARSSRSSLGGDRGRLPRRHAAAGGRACATQKLDTLARVGAPVLARRSGDALDALARPQGRSTRRVRQRGRRARARA